MKRLKIDYVDWMKMSEHVGSVSPREACGLLAGKSDQVESVYPVKNIATSQDRFQMGPSEQVQALFEIEASGSELLAIYHSHPEGPSMPSAADIEEWRYPDALSVIWSREAGNWVCRAYAQSASGFNEIKLAILCEGLELTGSELVISREKLTG